MASDHDFVRRMLQTVLTVAAVTSLVALFWAAREALMLVYISALIAMGFSPLVHMIERPRAGGRLPAVPRWLATLVILSFYLLIEARAMFEYWIRFVPAARRGDVAIAAREAVLKVSAWLSAQFVLAGVMGTFAAVGLGLMGVPYFYVVALVAAIG